MSRTYRKAHQRFVGKEYSRRSNGIRAMEKVGSKVIDGHWAAKRRCWCTWCQQTSKKRMLSRIADETIEEALKYTPDEGSPLL